MTIEEQKNVLRKTYRQKRQALSLEDKAAANDAIFRRLTELAVYQRATSVFCYVSVRDEIDTRRLINHVLAQGKTVSVPLCVSKGVMEARRISSLNELHPAPFGLLEPDKTAPTVPPTGMDLVVVPCLACDKNGVRLGYGGGFYDRYLAALTAPSVCLCREDFLVDALPRNTDDIPVHMVVTDKRLWKVNS